MCVFVFVSVEWRKFKSYMQLTYIERKRERKKEKKQKMKKENDEMAHNEVVQF